MMRTLLLCGSLLVPFGCTSSPDSAASSTDSTSTAQSLQVEDFSYQRLPEGTRVVSGALYNPTGTTVTTAQLQVSLFDASNRRISSMNILVQDIPAGERVRFSQPLDTDLDVQAARVRRVLLL